MNKYLPIVNVERLALGPNDIVLLRVEPITQQQADDLKAAFVKATGIKNRVMVIDSRVDVTVVGSDDA